MIDTILHLLDPIMPLGFWMLPRPLLKTLKMKKVSKTQKMKESKPRKMKRMKESKPRKMKRMKAPMMRMKIELLFYCSKEIVFNKLNHLCLYYYL
jgi:hypothetical protein